LRNRKDDVESLLNYFKQKYDSIYSTDSKEFDKFTLDLIENSEWEGNIRHLSNFVKNWTLFGNDATKEEIKSWINSESNNRIHSTDSFYFEQGTMAELDEAKKWLIHRALNLYDGNKSKAAEHIGVSYAGFLKMLKNME
jgi:DNA-binding NtrC family response regulator